MRFVKYLIIGAGISGLAFAARKKNEDLLILEKDIIPGGLAKSFHNAGFVWDVAGHFFHFHSESTKDYYESIMAGKFQRTVQKYAKVYYADKYIDAPFQYNIHQLSQDDFFECLTDLYYANCPAKNIPFDEFVKLKYGAGIANKFIIPYNEKLYACKLNDLECDSMGGFFPKLDFNILMNYYRGNKVKTYNDTFRYPIGGCETVISSLVDQIDKNCIHLSERVLKVDIEKRIVTTNEGDYRYEYLINTAPLNAFVKMIGDEEPTILKYNQILVLNIGFNKPSIDKQVSWIYYPGGEIFYRVGFYNNIAGTEQLSIYAEIGYKAEATIDVEIAMAETLAGLKRVNIIDDHSVVAFQHYIINPGYVHITANGKAYTEKTISKLENQHVYMIGRYARWQYSAMDDSLEQAGEIALKI